MDRGWSVWQWRFWAAGICGIGGAIAYTTAPTLAQITPDATLGTQNSVVTPHVTIGNQTVDQINGGVTRGANLFHSFQEFNVGIGQRLYFANPAGIENILSRVTGNNPSNILGTLGVNGPANLFLLNPHGITFGPNAKLDIAGSFFATTANSLVFDNGLQFSATNPEAPPLLTINLRPGLQYGSNHPGTISNAGNLAVGQNLTLAAGNLDLQGELHAGRDLTLQALDTVGVQDSVTQPFIASAGGQLLVQGNQKVNIFALNHPDSGLFSGGDMVLRSSSTVQGDAHYSTGGTFRIENLDGTPGILYSPQDPIIRASGDVVLGAYQGASLHIFAGGSVTIPGGVLIGGADPFPLDSIIEEVQLSNGTPLSINGSTKPTLDVRAGTNAIATPGITATPIIPSTLSTIPPQTTSTPTSSNITIGGILINAPNGVVFLTNQYQPNLSLPGGTIQVNGLTAVPGVTGAIITGSSSGNGGSVIIDSRSAIALNEAINASAIGKGGDITLLANGGITTSSIDSSSAGSNSGAINLTSRSGAINTTAGKLTASSLMGNGGDISLIANGDITTADINSLGLLGGTINLTSNGKVALNDSLILSASFTPVPGLRGGDINVNSQALSLTNGARLMSATFGAATGGNLNLNVSDAIELNGTQASSKLKEPELTQISTFLSSNLQLPPGTPPDAVKTILSGPSLLNTLLAINPSFFSQLLLQVPQEGVKALILAPGSPLNNPASSLLAITAGGTGAAGNVTIQAGQVSVRDGTEISSYSFGPGNAGNLAIKASDTVELIGTTPKNIPGGLYTQSYLTGNAGNISIDTGRLLVQGGSLASSTTFGQGKGGDLTVNADSVEVTGTTPDEQYPSALTASTRGMGDAGNLTVNARQVIIRDGAGLLSATSSGGNGGNLTVNASDSVELSGVSAIRGLPGGLSADTTGTGKAGSLRINTRRLSVRDGSTVSASTYGSGDGGSLAVNAAESVNLSGTSAAGIPSGLYAQGFGAGNAGNLQITTGQLRVENGAKVTVATGKTSDDLARFVNGTFGFGAGLQIKFSDAATGNAGTMTINANSLQLDNQGSVIAKTASGSGGNINLQVRDLIEMRRSSVISAEAFGDQITANGGNININTQFLVGVPNENNDIIANANGGPGGNIDIKAQSIFGLKFRNLLNPREVPTSDITASSRFGVQGSVTINTPDVDPSRGLTTLPTVPVDVERLVDRGCQADVAQKQSQFIVTGRGGLPPNPNEPIRDDSVLSDWVTLNPVAGSQPQATAPIPGENSSTQKLVEAQGWVIDSKGDVVLTATAPTVTPHRQWQTPTSCKGS
jgi:filamentous hemagglutinin family protein